MHGDDPLTGEALLTGRMVAPAAVRTLRAGPVTCELDGIELRSIRLGDQELINLVFMAVRDEAWNTIPGTVGGLTLTENDEGFHVDVRVRHTADGIDLSWEGVIDGRPDGTISYGFEAVAAADLRYNRIGFNVLHSVRDAAGRPYRTFDETGRPVESGSLPVAIARQAAVGGRLSGMLAPFRRIEVDLSSHLTVVLEVSGDDFESEDQRNYADSTFKTYSTPLQRPAPHVVQAGSRLAQSVRVTPAGDRHRQRPSRPVNGSVRVDIGEPLSVRLPTFGIGVASDGVAMAPSEVERIATLEPGHLRVVVSAAPGTSAAAPARLQAAATDARALGTRLEVELILGADGAGLDHAADMLAGVAELVDVVLVRAPGSGPIDIGTPATVVAAARDRLGRILPGASVGAMVATLAALIREPVDGATLGIAGLPLSPTVHRDDDRTVMENLLGLDEQVQTGIEVMGGRPVRVGPVTLATVNGPWPAGATRALGLPPQVDVRQPSLFAAAWTVGAVARLLVSGARSVTLFETTSWRGVLEREAGSPSPGAFLSIPGGVYPVWHVLADLAGFRAMTAVAVAVADPLRTAALAVTSAAGTLLLVANLTRQPVDVDLRLPAGMTGSCHLRILDEATGAQAVRDPDAFRRTGERRPIGAQVLLPLNAYAVATLHVSG